MKKHIVLLVCAISQSHLMVESVSVVYNLRISNITRRQIDPSGAHPNIITATPFGQWRLYRNGARSADSGIIGSYIYAKPAFYFKLDTAFGHINYKKGTLHIARRQTDDILLTAGSGHAVGKRGQMAYSALLGIPTHRDYILELANIGIGHTGLGAQLDSSCNLEHSTLFAALRLIHFLPRTAQSHNPCLRSLYTSCAYDVRPGNLADIFVSHQTRWGSHNRFEVGYDATFIFGGSITPTISDATSLSILMRHSFFGVYFKSIFVNNRKTGLVVGLSGGFDSKPKQLGARYHLTAWGSWGILF